MAAKPWRAMRARCSIVSSASHGEQRRGCGEGGDRPYVVPQVPLGEVARPIRGGLDALRRERGQGVVARYVAYPRDEDDAQKVHGGAGQSKPGAGLGPAEK